jgi:hypothetical protein
MNWLHSRMVPPRTVLATRSALSLSPRCLRSFCIPTTGTMSGKGKGGRGDKKSVTKSSKAGLQFPVARVGRYLKAGRCESLLEYPRDAFSL